MKMINGKMDEDDKWWNKQPLIIQIRTQAMEKLRHKPRIDMETLNYQSTNEHKIVEQEGMEFVRSEAVVFQSVVRVIWV